MSEVGAMCPRIKVVQKWSFLTVVGLTIGGCSAFPQLFKDEKKSTRTTPDDQPDSAVVVPTSTNADGAVVASISSANSRTQRIEVTEAGLNGSSLEFPPGSLAVSTEIQVQNAAPIASPGTAAELGIGGGFSQSGAAVLVTSSAPQNAVVPFTMSLPLPTNVSLALMQSGEDSSLAVVYRVTDETRQETRTGMIPRSSITVNDRTASFRTDRFGTYQTVYLGETTPAPVEVPTQTAILTQKAADALPPMEVHSRRPFVVKPGETVEVRGINFRSSILLAWNGAKVDAQFKSDSLATFVAPSSGSFGLTNLLLEQDGNSQTISLFYAGTAADFPIITASPQDICAGLKFYDKNGDMQTGSKNCSGPDLTGLTPAVLKAGVAVAGVTGIFAPDCISDGQGACLVDGSNYKAAKMANFAASDVKSGITVAGLAGTGALESHSECSADGATGCVANASYKAAKMLNVVGGNIKSGVSIAGVAGNLSAESHISCATDGEAGCVVVGPAFKAADMNLVVAGNIKAGVTIAGTAGSFGPACSVDGGGACLVDGTIYKAAKLSNFTGADVKAGITIAGIAGSGTLEGHSDCSADGSMGCVATATYTAALTTGLAPKIVSGNTVAGITGTASAESHNDCAADGSTGCVATATYTAALTTGLAAKVLSGQTVAGIGGSAIEESHITCSSDGAIGCVTTGSYKSANMVNAVAANIKSGATIAGVAGSVTEESHTDCNADGGTGCVATATYTAALTTGLAAKVVAGHTVAGIPGTATAESHNSCAADGDVGCVVVGPGFKAADMNFVNAGNIKAGATIAGVAGNFPSATYPLTGATATSDLTSMAAATAAGTYEFWDSVGSRYTGTIADASTITPGTSNQIFNSSLYRQFTVAGDADLVAANITGGTELFGVAGSGILESHSSCTGDNQTGCITTATYKAADTTGIISSDLKTGKTIAGITGNLNNCSSNGEAGCVVVAPAFKAADMSLVTAGNVKSGVNIAGVLGDYPSATYPLSGASGTTDLTSMMGITAAGSYEFWDSAGTRFTGEIADAGIIAPGNNDQTYGASLYRQFTVQGDADLAAANVANGVNIFGIAGTATLESHSNCGADGGIGCVTTATYAAAYTTGLAAKVVSGNTVAGIAGSAQEESHTTCNTDGATGCITSVSFKAANMSNVLAANIKSTITIAGVAGSLTPESHTNCAADGAVGCVTTASYKAANMTIVNAGTIKSGTVIAGVTGQYPSGSYPLASATATADLDLATFDAKIKSAVAFEWFDSSGTLHTNTGDPDIVAANILSNATIFGTTGAVLNCTADNQVGCVTNGPFRSADTNAFNAWDIRRGKTVAGVSGNIAFFKNMADTSVFDRSSGTAGAAGLDVYDTVEDTNNNAAFPTQNPGGWFQANGSNWTMDPTSDNGTGGGVAGDGICNGGEACVYIDNLTGIYWARDDGTSRNWENSITLCENLAYGGYTDWRVPTQKELMQAYTNGIWSKRTPLNLDLGVFFYWSSTTVSTSIALANAWVVYLDSGATSNLNIKASGLARVSCVR